MTTLFGVLLYGFGVLFILVGPDQPASSDGELVVKVLSLAATAIAALVLYVMTALYVVSFVLDWWHVSKADRAEWSPTGWYLLIPLAALGNFIIPVIATPVITIGGAYYLFERSRMIGQPEVGRLR